MAPSTLSAARTALRRSWSRWTLKRLARQEHRLLRRQQQLELKLEKVRQRALLLSPPPVLSISPQQLERMQQLGELMLKPSPLQALMLQEVPPSTPGSTFVIPPGSAAS